MANKKRNSFYKDFIKEEYKKCFRYLHESRKFIYAVIIIFSVFLFIGFLFPVPENISQEIFKYFNELIEKTKDMSQGELIKFIFLNNLQTSFFGMIFGFFFSIFPFAVSIVNGYMLGFVASITVDETGFFALWRIFPHGIFELPAVFISLGLGLKFGTFMFNKNRSRLFREYLWNSIRVFLFIIIPLLIIAAIIEGILISLF